MRRGGITAAALALALLLSACTSGSSPASTPAGPAERGSRTEVQRSGLTVERSLELQYAEQFSVDYCEGGCALIRIGDENEYLVVPEGVPVPAGLPETVVVLQQPLEHIYLVATSAMDLFCALDGVESIRLSGTDADGWYIDEVKEAMERGEMLYAGKYSAPDYELIHAEQCDLAVESTMIYHTPEVKEQLERLGVPVLVERSSYESSPLGRMEWLKLYGVLLGQEEEAAAIYQQELDSLRNVIGQESTGKTVAFFYITSTGAANVRKSGDYVARMIEMAGGQYVFQDLGDDNALSTMNMQMETFYAEARDADCLIYNSTIDGELHTIDELLVKSPLLADFKAVQEGNVWCTEQNLFQSTMGLGDMILDIHAVLTEESPENLTFLHRLT